MSDMPPVTTTKTENKPNKLFQGYVDGFCNEQQSMVTWIDFGLLVLISFIKKRLTMKS